MNQNEIHYEHFTRSFHIVLLTPDTLIINDRSVQYLYTAENSQSVNGLFEEEKSSFIVSMLRGLLGIVVLLGLAFLFSSNRRAIKWKGVFIGLGIQVSIAILVLKVPFIQYGFEFVGKMFIKVLDFTKEGSTFLFKSFISDQVESPLINFAFWILPTIVFFSALTSILYYYGIIQKVVYGMAWLMKKLLGLSGAESLSATGNIFLGQTEAPLLIKAYLAKMTRSELLLVMVGGMATIAGGVLAIYIGFLGGDDPVQRMLFAKHLITASVMAAPGAVVAAKILLPETEKIDTNINISKDKIGSNVLDAISNGTTEGVKLAVNVAAMLLVFIALVALVNFVFMKIGDATSLNAWISEISKGQYDKFSLQFILGYGLAPLTWIIGVSSQDMTLVGQLLGEKMILNELIAYKSLKEYVDLSAFANQKSTIIATYILCGFANIGSIGIQLGGIGALAPNQRKTLSQLGIKALIGGTIASLLSATIVGVILS
ncbi:MAG: nucleoside transporter C-terminal domain-containing protein [Bacteroidota bacterium]